MLSVSVVIPVRDEAGSLPRLLESLLSQSFAPAEIIVVDGGSRDATTEILKAYSQRDSRIRLIEAGDATPGRGRNVGIAAATHEWIALTDAGAWPERSWLHHLVDALERYPTASIVYGNCEPVVDTFFCQCAALAYVSPKQARPDGLLRAPFIASSLLNRDVWRAAGGFPDLRAGEDLIFMNEVARRGARVGFAPKAVVWWELQRSLAGTFRRFLLYSRHNVVAGLQRHWHYGVARQYAAAAGVVVLAAVQDWRWMLLLPAGLALRTARLIWRHRASHRWITLANPVQFLGVAAIVLAIDAATFIGWAQALIGRESAARPKWARQR